MITKCVAAPAPSWVDAETTLVSPVPLKVSVYDPIGPAMPRPVNVAMPAPSVVVVVIPRSVAPPPVRATETWTPAWLTGVPPELRSCTEGWMENAVPLDAVPDGCVVTVSWVAGTVTAIVPDEAPARLPLENPIVKLPGAVTVMPRPGNVASPLASVFAVADPMNEPPEPVSVAFTGTPA